MFEGLKKSMLERIEKDSIKVNVDGERVYIKKSNFFGWRVIHPPINPETGGWNKLNLIFGGKANALFGLFLLIITLLFWLGIRETLSSYDAFINNPIVQICLRNAGFQIG